MAGRGLDTRGVRHYLHFLARRHFVVLKHTDNFPFSTDLIIIIIIIIFSISLYAGHLHLHS
jgi:hypothetical protein